MGAESQNAFPLEIIKIKKKKNNYIIQGSRKENFKLGTLKVAFAIDTIHQRVTAVWERPEEEGIPLLTA